MIPLLKLLGVLGKTFMKPINGVMIKLVRKQGEKNNALRTHFIKYGNYH